MRWKSQLGTLIESNSAKSGGNTEKDLLKNTTVIKLLKHYFFIKVLVTKEKKRNKKCDFDLN